MNNQQKGYVYEEYIKSIIIQRLGKNAYLWNECPENILIENNLIHSHNDMRLLRKSIKEGKLHNHQDIGIDIIQIENGKCSIIQCKNGYKKGLCVYDLAGIMMRSAFGDNTTYIYYTDAISKNVKNTAKMSPYVSFMNCSRNSNDIDKITQDAGNKINFIKLPYEDTRPAEPMKTSIVPYIYQEEAICKLKKHYEKNTKGILSLPCGCGKTYVGYRVSHEYKWVVILSPLREFANQNLKRFIEYGYDEKKTLLVDTDGVRDIDMIKEFIKTSSKGLISCTYNSMDLISQCLELFQDTMFIIDEFHNLSAANISNNENPIYKLLKSSHKQLFMSATPRVYEIENEENDYDIDDVFGEVVYQMTFADAIANKYITDYRVWLPSIHENNDTLDKELSIYNIDAGIKNRCKFFYSCISNNGSRKCIVYCKDTEDMNAMIECINTLNDFYMIEMDIHSICCEDNENKRKHTLECFDKNNSKVQILFNIRILNECIDIPSCDSIYISYAPKNKITTIQRISRSTRINTEQPHKIANVYMWCEMYNDIMDVFSSIKEYDILFKDKIKVNTIDFYHNKDVKAIKIRDDDTKALEDCIINIKEYKVMTWEAKIKKVEEYIETHKKLPPTRDATGLGDWIHKQKTYYNKSQHGMKDRSRRKAWEDFTAKYAPYFMTLDKQWEIKIKKVEEYIETHKKLPQRGDATELGVWINTQKINYKTSTNGMKDGSLRRKAWENFTAKYAPYFMTWEAKMKEVEKYIETHKTLPQRGDATGLGNWINIQKTNYKTSKDGMKDGSRRKAWGDFTAKYAPYFMTLDEQWEIKIKKVKEYIEKHKKLPPAKNATELGVWINTQKINYKTSTNGMKDGSLRRKAWENFTAKYAPYFMTLDEQWEAKMKEVEKYIETHKTLPQRGDATRLRNWISQQKNDYKTSTNGMKDGSLRRKAWEDFTAKYTGLFK